VDYNKNKDEDNSKAEKFVKRKMKNFNDKYDRGRLIGKGAFGQVFECWIKGTGGREEKFALKILKKSLLS
jgi:serine/threonine protein kinase